MKMMLSLSIALAHDPKLLILDEATSGLDPVVICDSKDELLEHYGILHCSEADLANLDRSHIKGVRKSSFGCEVLIDNRDTLRPAKDNMPIDAASLENIMLLTIKGGNF